MKSDELISEYIDAATKHDLAIQQGNDKMANKQYLTLNNIYSKMKLDDNLKRNILSNAIQNQNTGVKIWASAHSLGLNFNTDLAISVLKKLSQNRKIGIQSFNAQMTLETYEKQGYLNF